MKVGEKTGQSSPDDARPVRGSRRANATNAGVNLGPSRTCSPRFPRKAVTPPRPHRARSGMPATEMEKHYFTSDRRSITTPTTSGTTIQISVVVPSIAHSRPVFVVPLKSSTCV